MNKLKQKIRVFTKSDKRRLLGYVNIIEFTCLKCNKVQRQPYLGKGTYVCTICYDYKIEN